MDLEKNSFEILKMKYEDHVEDLRFRHNFDFRLLSGFVTLNLIIAAWLYKNPDLKIFYKIIFSIFISVLSSSTIMLFIRNYYRRKIIVNILQNINEAFKFYDQGIYFKGQINPEINRKTTYWTKYYILVVIVVLISQIIMIFR